MAVDVEGERRDVGVRMGEEVLLLLLRELLSRQFRKGIGEVDGCDPILGRAGPMGRTERAILPHHVRYTDVASTSTSRNPRVKGLRGKILRSSGGIGSES
jgi:hypothetical protein